MKSNHLFSRIPRAEIQRSSFDRSHSMTTTMNSGDLVPIFVDEVLPGDTFNLKCSIFSRITTMVVPVFDNIHFDTHFFFVPNRLVWDNFQKFMGEQDSPGDSTDYLVPELSCPSGGFAVGSLADHFGIPVGVSGLHVNALPFRAYNRIYQEWFRDENLIDAVDLEKGDGPDTYSKYPIQKRGKRHDYFTSCLPWPQKGPGVELPLQGQAPVHATQNLYANFEDPADRYAPVYGTHSPLVGRWAKKADGSWVLADPSKVLGTSITSSARTSTVQLNAPEGGFTSPIPQFFIGDEADHTNVGEGAPAQADLSGVYGTVQVPDFALVADLTAASSATINSLRTAMQLQRFYERDARGGTRYTELIRSHFGVVSPDARLQRPEYLGGSSSVMQVNSVVQQSATATGQTPQGNLSAYGILGSKTHGFTKSFTEHGYIIGLLSIRTDLRYQQGLNRMWSRKTREDFYWPTFAHLGEQAVLNKEIYAQGDGVTDSDGNVIDDQPFGYQERYAEYRYYPSLITGKMRSGVDGSLDVWHLAQHFENLPTLNKTFIEEDVPMSRVLAVEGEPEFKVDCFFNMRCVRPMPVYSVPGLMDHF